MAAEPTIEEYTQEVIGIAEKIGEKLLGCEDKAKKFDLAIQVEVMYAERLKFLRSAKAKVDS